MKEKTCPAVAGNDDYFSCQLAIGHKGAHKDNNFSWLNKDRPREEQGWMCYEEKIER